jgi:hypothetical protein
MKEGKNVCEMIVRMRPKFWSANPEGRDIFENLGVEGK